jgi:hypothetical protein
MKTLALLSCILFLQQLVSAQSGPAFSGCQNYPVSTSGVNTDENADFVLPTSDGGYLLVGSFYFGSGDWDGRVIKTSPTGAVSWEKKPGGPGYDFLRSAVEVSDGYVVVGEYQHNGLPKVWAIKYDFQGNVTWGQGGGYIYTASANFPGNKFTAFTVTQTYGNRILIGGAIGGFVTPQPIPTPPARQGTCG